MEKIWLSLKRGKVNCYRFGNGPKLVIALHGFTRTGASFQVLDLGNDTTLYAPDLPFHGLTEWTADYFDQHDLLEIVEAILAIYPPQQPFYWLGYSLGGRLVLSEWRQFETQLAGMILIAPDGFSKGIKGLPHQMSIGLRQWVCQLLERPQWFLKWCVFLRRTGLISPFIHQYLQKNLETAENRRRLLGIWKSVAHFNLRKQKTANPDFPIWVVLGRQDHIIPLTVVHSLRELFPEAEVHWRECGHQLINRGTGEILRKQII